MARSDRRISRPASAIATSAQNVHRVYSGPGFVLLHGGHRRLPEANVRRFRNRLRRLRDRYHAGTVDLDQAMRHIRSWVEHAGYADT